MIYRVSYWTGNGYYCSCCRSTDENTIDFDSKSELVKWLADFNISKERDKDSDCGIDSVDIIADEITSTIFNDEEYKLEYNKLLTIVEKEALDKKEAERQKQMDKIKSNFERE